MDYVKTILTRDSVNSSSSRMWSLLRYNNAPAHSTLLIHEFLAHKQIAIVPRSMYFLPATRQTSPGVTFKTDPKGQTFDVILK